MVAKTILIADGGSTKTDWSIVSGNREIDRIKTRGINPFFQTEEEISAEIRDNLIPRIRKSDSVEAVYFYGAGCAFPERTRLYAVLSRTICRSRWRLAAICWQPPVPFVETVPVLPVFWGPVPTPACMTERILSKTYLRWALSWEMRGVVPYLGNCWLGMC